MNKKNNGEDEFTHVMKKMLGGAHGINLGKLTKGSKVIKTVSHDFEGSFVLPPNGLQGNWPDLDTEHTIENWDDLLVIMWVQNVYTKEVYQAGKASQITLGLNEIENESAVSVYPNPTAGDVRLELNLINGSEVTVEITNSLGQIVKTKDLGYVNSGIHSSALMLEGIENGVYFVKVRTLTSTITKTLILRK